MANNPNPLGFKAVVKALRDHSNKSMTGSPDDLLDAAIAFGAETDRGAIILATTAFEDHLEQALVRKFVKLNSDETGDLFGFDAPLRSFSAKIRVAHAVGILDGTRKQMAEVIRTMRNTCAHAGQGISFKDKALVDAMEYLLQQSDSSGKEMGLYGWEQQGRPDWPRFLFLLMLDGLTESLFGKPKKRRPKYGDLFKIYCLYMAAREVARLQEQPTQSPPENPPAQTDA